MTTKPNGDTPSPARPSRRRWRFGVLLGPLRIVVGIYLIVILLMMFLEESLIYFPPTQGSGNWNAASIGAEDAHFESSDGTKLHGWYVEHPQPRAHLLFCHGNAEDVAHLAGLLQIYRDEMQVSVLAFDYRGYGKSEGKPGEAGILADARAAQEWLAKRAGIRPQDVVIAGRSIGGGVAVDAAAHNGARGLVLERTFTSMPDAAAAIYPWLPVKLLMRSQYNSLEKIKNYHGPLLQSHGTADEVISYEIGRALFDAAPSTQKTFVSEEGMGHNDMYTGAYLDALKQFIAELPALE